MTGPKMGPASSPYTVNPITVPADASTDELAWWAAPAPEPAFSTPSYSAATPFGVMSAAIGGEWVKLRHPVPGPPERREWRRGEVVQFSARSRSRMLQSLAQLDRRRVSHDALFVTFTYPADFPDARACKLHLEAFAKRMHRRHPAAWFYWRLEFQQRGAPHFHLLIFGLPLVNPNSLHHVWHDVIGSTDPYHVRYGTDVKRLTSWREVGGYCAKYCAKEDTEASDHPGRYWGIAYRANRPVELQSVTVTEREFFAIRRLCRRILRAGRGYHAAGGSSSGVWVRISERSAKRMLGWAARLSSSLAARDGPTPAGAGASPDRRSGGTYSSSTTGVGAARQSTTDRSEHSTTLELFDSTDRQARWARRFWR